MGDIFFRSNVELIEHVKAVRTKCVAAFEETSALVTEDGAVHMFGCGLEGQLGNGTLHCSSFPLAVSVSLVLLFSRF